MAKVGRVIVGDWKGSGADRHLEVKIYPTQKPVESASGKSTLNASDTGIRLPSGETLSINLFTPKQQ